MSRVNDLAGLREQIQAGQRNRTEFVGNLARSGAEMKRANQVENKQRRRNLLETLMAFVINLTRSGVELRTANQAENKERRHNFLGTLSANEARRRQEAWRLQNARAEFVTNLARSGAEMKMANQAENAAAQAAWFGRSTMKAASAKRGGKWFGEAA
ncbi:MAG: hypothetical protein Q8R07_00435 [Candidatus Uhrbacteria bacterium]|nr:hypothetical protein [Candidatus Uhrbacteria bacterium]